LSLVTSLT